MFLSLEIFITESEENNNPFYINEVQWRH